MTRSRFLVLNTVVLAVLVITFAGIASVIAFRNAASAEQTLLGVTARELDLERVLSAMRDAETGQRGFLLTQREDYLEPYEIALREIAARIDQLMPELAGDAEQGPNLERLRTEIEAKRAELAETIRIARDDGIAPALAMVTSGVGKNAMDRIRETVLAMQTVEEARAARAADGVAHARAVALVSVAALAVLAVVMITVLLYVMRRSVNQLRVNEQRLAITLTSIGDAVIATDQSARVTLLNPVAERLTGWSTGEAAGRPVGNIFKIINEHSRNTVESPIDRVLREGVVLGLANHTVLIARDGTETPIEDSAAPILDANREIRGVVLVFRDASTARAVERALHAADERKNEFLAVLAHELRNPLAPIRQAAAIASSKSASPAQIAWSTEVIERQVGHMARLLDDLLDVSRITRGTLDIRRTAITVANAVDAATEMARPLIEARQHRLVIEMPPEPLWIEADALRLAQVIGNLLTNAAKFTPPGGQITLSATAHEHAVEIRVSDTGIGLPRDAIDKIFDMFVQIGPALQRAEGGLGIGLALAKGLVELHGGSIRAESAGPDRGTTITVTLPHGVPAGSDAAVAAVSTPAPTPRGTTVVVADDNRDAAESLAMLLRLQGHEVTTAHTGSDALAAIQRVRPRLALLDIGMPDMTGYEVATAVRGASWGKSVKLVALTGWGQEADRARALEAGFDDHWVKPVDPALAAGYCADMASAGRS